MWLEYTAKDVARFWVKVDCTAGLFECWIWTACISGGYGMLRWGKRDEHASRISYLLANGPFAWELEVCHDCDHPSCVNPSHLFLGTHQDNVDDMAKKGRRATFCGKDNGRCKLSDEQIAEIRRLYAMGGVSQEKLGRAFGISQPYIGLLIRGKSRP